MDLAAAAALLESQLALENSVAACVALAKYQVPCTPELALALEKVGSYTANESGRTSLHKALIHGDAATVRALLVAGAKTTDIEHSNGATALDLATDDTCREMLEHHAAVYASITEDPTMLVAAALAHCATLSASEKLLPAMALSLRGHHFDPCFLWAPPAARAAVVTWAQHIFIAQLAATIQSFGQLPDDCAGDVLVFFGMAMTVKDFDLIGKHCSSPEARTWVRAVVAAAVVAKATAELVPAAQIGDSTTVLDCLAKKANIETKMFDGYTALALASRNGHAATVQVLVGAGADKEAKDEDGRTALILASQGGYAAIVQFLMDAGADKEIKDNFDGFTALMHASRNGHTATVKVLLGAGADIEAKDKFDGKTALILASRWGHTKTVQVLVKAGADKKTRDWFGKAALDYAGNNTAVKALLKK